MPGDKIVATLNESVTGSNGAVIPAGSTVVLEVASVTPGDNGADPQDRAAREERRRERQDVPSIGRRHAARTARQDEDRRRRNADKKKVVGGAIAGAILGQIIGHNTKGTLIGAAAGAATGAAVGHQGEKWAACLPAGAPMRLTLSSPIMM